MLTFLLVNGALVTANVLSGGTFWAIWPLVAWGLGLALQGARALPPPSPDDRERILRRVSKRRARQARMQAKRERDAAMRAVGQEFEAVVEQGVAELLRAVSRGLSTAAKPAEPEVRRSAPRARVGVEDAEVGAAPDAREAQRRRERR